MAGMSIGREKPDQGSGRERRLNPERMESALTRWWN